MGHTDAAKSSFYDTVWQTVRMLRGTYPTASLRILADANGRVGSVPSSAVGAVCAEKENDGGQRFQLLCEHYGLAMYNTFFDAAPTWTSTHGTQHRIDYVVRGAYLARVRR